jgi:hypothetical protein
VRVCRRIGAVRDAVKTGEQVSPNEGASPICRACWDSETSRGDVAVKLSNVEDDPDQNHEDNYAEPGHEPNPPKLVSLQ